MMGFLFRGIRLSDMEQMRRIALPGSAEALTLIRNEHIKDAEVRNGKKDGCHG
jgi:hypothetical protein